MAEPDVNEGVGRPPESLIARLRAEPERAPEHIALAAAERFAPQAERWVSLWPGHEPAKLARVAYRKHVRLARVEGAALGLGGFVTAVPDVVALIWIQCRMVFYIGAAHGYDPRHPMRPAELLAIQEVYPTRRRGPRGARRRRQAHGDRARRASHARARPGAARAADALRAAPGRAQARRGGSIPLVGAPIGAVQNGNATKEVGTAGAPLLRRRSPGASGPPVDGHAGAADRASTRPRRGSG